MRHKVNRKHKLLLAAVLIILTVAAYQQVRKHEFINFDDDIYVTDNQIVSNGLSLEGLKWALGFNQRGYWQPLTWLSHMLDCEIYGLNPSGHHLNNLLLHLANVLLLFGVLTRMTGSWYKSFLAAALFALHPLNVDSVAWIAERKNLLSTFFLMASLLAYRWYAETPRIGRYLLTLVFFILGLMVKPMLVTLPFVLLLLDYWPLGRLEFAGKPKAGTMAAPPARSGARPSQPIVKLCLEKLPFLVLALGSVWLSISSSQHINNMVDLAKAPMTLRIGNALVSYVAYIGKMFFPLDLAVYYPFPDSIPLWQPAGAVVLLTAATGFCLYQIKRKPYLAVGWFWYLGTLLPVIGIVQNGLWPEMADRWSYVPLIGLFVMIAWGIPEALPNRRFAKPVMAFAALAVIGSLFFITRAQLNHWKSSRTLFEHALRITAANAVAHNNLGNALLNEGQIHLALHHFQAALKIDPGHAGTRNNMGNALMELGRVEEAVGYYLESVRINPLAAKTHNNLAVALAEKTSLDDAVAHLREALRLKPDYAEAYNNLGAVYRQKGQVRKAAKCYLNAIRLRPGFSEAYNNLGLLLLKAGRLKEAEQYFSQALMHNPDYTAAGEGLAKVRSLRDVFIKKVAERQSELRHRPEDPASYLKLGNLYKTHGELDHALNQYQAALRIRPDFAPARQQSAVIYAMKGEYSQAIELLEGLVKHEADNVEICYFLAGIYARLNKIEDSIFWLKKAIAKGYNNWDELKNDRNFDSIRETAYYQALEPVR